MHRLFIILTILIVLHSCASQQVAERSRSCEPVTAGEFLDDPFYFDLSIDSVQARFGKKIRLTRFLRNVGGGESKKDTIYRFHRNASSFVFYITSNGDESFLTSKIGDPAIEMRSCIRIGMPRIKVEEQINGFPSDFRDTVDISNNRRQAVFVFEDSRLKQVFINNYFR